MLLTRKSNILKPLVIIRTTDASLSERIDHISHIDEEGDDSAHGVALQFRKFDLAVDSAFIEGFLNLSDPELKPHV